MSNFISDKWLRPADPFEVKYQECIEDATNGKHSTNADDCQLQDSVARIVAIEMKLNPLLLALDTNPDTFARIGYQVAKLVADDFERCARFYAEAA